METPDHPHHLGFGVTARPEVELDELAGLGPELESLGYWQVWANDGQSAHGLPTLAAIAVESRRLDLGLGVAPLSERTADEIADHVERLDLPLERLVLGLGTGRSSSLDLIRDGVARVRERLPGVRVAVSALGPRMCRLAGEVADVVLLNWAFPARIAWSRQRVTEGADAAGRLPPRVASYVRVAVGPGAEERLLAEAERYRGRQSKYRGHFEAQGADEDRVPGAAAVEATDIPGLLAPYREALDDCIVRAVPAERSRAALVEIARAAVAS